MFYQKYKFSNKNDMVSAWMNFKNIFSRPLFTIFFKPEMLKFPPYSILTRDTMVRFVIFCVLMYCLNIEYNFYVGTLQIQDKSPQDQVVLRLPQKLPKVPQIELLKIRHKSYLQRRRKKKIPHLKAL